MRRRRKALFSFTGKSGIMLITGVLMAAIAAFNDDDLLGMFDREDSTAQPLPAQLPCQLLHIADGDTIKARCAAQELRIRLMGIDTPEMGQKPWGEYSKQALAEHLPQEFILHSHGQDVYRRTLGTLYAEGKDINLHMVVSGMAVAYRGKDTPQSYFAAEKQAKAAKLGIWSQPGDQQDPRKWRRYHQ